MISAASLKAFDKDFLRTFGRTTALDGILNLSVYNRATPKILWILKERNGGSSYLGNVTNGDPIPEAELEAEWAKSCEARDFFNDVTTYAKWRVTFSRICYVTYGLLEGITHYEAMPKIDAAAKINDTYHLDHVAFINVKKSPGGSVSNHRHITDSYLAHKDFLNRQIDFINPDVILECSGVKPLRTDLAAGGFHDSDLDCAYTNGRLIVNSYHPAYRFMREDVYVNTTLQRIAAMRELIKALPAVGIKKKRSGKAS